MRRARRKDARITQRPLPQPCDFGRIERRHGGHPRETQHDVVQQPGQALVVERRLRHPRNANETFASGGRRDGTRTFSERGNGRGSFSVKAVASGAMQDVIVNRPAGGGRRRNRGTGGAYGQERGDESTVHDSGWRSSAGPISSAIEQL